MGCSVRKVRSLWIGGWGVGIRMVRCFHRPYLHRFSRPFPFFHPSIHHPGLQAVSHHAALSPFTQIRSWRIRTPWTQKRGGLKKEVMEGEKLALFTLGSRHYYLLFITRCDVRDFFSFFAAEKRSAHLRSMAIWKRRFRIVESLEAACSVNKHRQTVLTKSRPCYHVCQLSRKAFPHE